MVVRKACRSENRSQMLFMISIYLLPDTAPSGKGA